MSYFNQALLFYNVIHEMLFLQLSEKRKQAKKEGKMTIEEDDPELVSCNSFIVSLFI